MAQVLPPWQYRERDGEEWPMAANPFQFMGPLSSPPLSPEGAPLAEYASFLPMMDNFSLEDDMQSAQSHERHSFSVQRQGAPSKGMPSRLRLIRNVRIELSDLISLAHGSQSWSESYKTRSLKWIRYLRLKRSRLEHMYRHRVPRSPTSRRCPRVCHGLQTWDLILVEAGEIAFRTACR